MARARVAPGRESSPPDSLLGPRQVDVVDRRSDRPDQLGHWGRHLVGVNLARNDDCTWHVPGDRVEVDTKRNVADEKPHPDQHLDAPLERVGMRDLSRVPSGVVSVSLPLDLPFEILPEQRFRREDEAGDQLPATHGGSHKSGEDDQGIAVPVKDVAEIVEHGAPLEWARPCLISHCKPVLP